MMVVGLAQVQAASMETIIDFGNDLSLSSIVVGDQGYAVLIGRHRRHHYR